MPSHSFNVQENDFIRVNGPLIQVDITVPLALNAYLATAGLPAHSVRSGHALIDTGAGVSAVDESIFTELEIPHVESEMVLTSNGAAEFKVFNASCSFPDFELYNLPLRRILGCDIRTQSPSGYDLIMLLGRDILRNFVMVYDGPKSHVTFHI